MDGTKVAIKRLSLESTQGPSMEATHVSTMVKGSFGYLDPEYFRRQLLTEKSDVYSFGVVLLEVLCARAAIDGTLPHKEANIVEWAWKFWKDDEFEEVLDQRMKGTYSLESVKKVAELAFTCLAEYGVDRPTMGEALWHLEGALTVQDSEMPHVELTIHPLTDLTVPTSTGESGSNSPGTVDRTREAFSQLFETQGR
eukprot:SM000018S03689  [mRNA]  locus=s18:790698:792371:+ [translate_table: standard]